MWGRLLLVVSLFAESRELVEGGNKNNLIVDSPAKFHARFHRSGALDRLKDSRPTAGIREGHTGLKP